MNEKIERIKKLLKLSTSPNANEAEFALAKAHALATEAGIDLAIAAANLETPQVKEEFVKEEIISGKRHNVCQKLISWLICAHFNCDIVFSGDRQCGRIIHFIGRKSDVELAVYINGFLAAEFMRRWHDFKNTNNLPCKERNSYIYGLYEGLNEKLKAAKKQTEDNRFAAIGKQAGAFDIINDTNNSNFATEVKEKYYLMIRTEKEERQVETAKHFPRLRKAQSDNSSLTGSTDSRETGRAHGRQININRPISSQLCLS